MVIAHLTSNNAIQFKGDSSCRFHQVSSELTTQNLSCFSHGRNERYGPQRVQAAGSIDDLAPPVFFPTNNEQSLLVVPASNPSCSGCDQTQRYSRLRRLETPLTIESHLAELLVLSTKTVLFPALDRCTLHVHIMQRAGS
jgi:hypothetical protein